MRQIMFVAAVLVAGCGDDIIACDVTSTNGSSAAHTCAEIENSKNPDGEEADCRDRGQVKATLVDSCSTTDLVGTCVRTDGDQTVTIFFYKAGGFTAELGKQTCDSLSGVWTAK